MMLAAATPMLASALGVWWELELAAFVLKLRQDVAFVAELISHRLGAVRVFIGESLNDRRMAPGQQVIEVFAGGFEFVVELVVFFGANFHGGNGVFGHHRFDFSGQLGNFSVRQFLTVGDAKGFLRWAWFFR